jgi:uncharacterized repeat protein (TIGR01451 family)
MLPIRNTAKWFVVIATVLLAVAQPAAAQTGADLDVDIYGKRAVRYQGNITYTIVATNVGDETATGVQLYGWVPDWFNFVSVDCGDGVHDDYGACNFNDLAPGESVSMTITVQACCPEPHMFEMGWATATNDVNPNNNEARIKVVFTGPKH